MRLISQREQVLYDNYGQLCTRLVGLPVHPPTTEFMLQTPFVSRLVCRKVTDEFSRKFSEAVHLAMRNNQEDYSSVQIHACFYTFWFYLLILGTFQQQNKLDGCIVWNAHNTVLGSKHSAICAQAVYLLHSTMPSVTCLWLSDVSVICCVNYLQFPIQFCFSSTSVS